MSSGLWTAGASVGSRLRTQWGLSVSHWESTGARAGLMNRGDLNIRRIDSRRDDIRAAMAELRQRLSPRGNVVSEAGRRRTIEVFGEPLSPPQVVERICDDVRSTGWRPCSTTPADRQGRADGRDAPRAGSRAGPGPCRGRSGAARGRSPGARATSASFRRRSCTTTCGSSGPAGTWSSATGRWIAWASACRAGRRRILRPC